MFYNSVHGQLEKLQKESKFGPRDLPIGSCWEKGNAEVRHCAGRAMVMIGDVDGTVALDHVFWYDLFTRISINFP